MTLLLRMSPSLGYEEGLIFSKLTKKVLAH